MHFAVFIEQSEAAKGHLTVAVLAAVPFGLRSEEFGLRWRGIRSARLVIVFFAVIHQFLVLGEALFVGENGKALSTRKD